MLRKRRGGKLTLRVQILGFRLHETGLVQKIVQLHSQRENQRMKTMSTANAIAQLSTVTKGQASGFAPILLPLPHTCDLMWNGGF